LNNLRRDIRAAFEVIEPPLGGMPERVVQTVLAERNGRLRKEKMAYRLRISLALVAAVLVVAVGAAAVITWNSLHNANVTPAGQVHLTSLQALESRQVDLPRISTTAACPYTATSTSAPYDFGTGPVFADGGPQINTSWGYYYDVIWFTPQNSGPVLIRGRDLQSDLGVVFVDEFATGPVIGTDAIGAQPVQQHGEEALQGKPPAIDTRGRVMWHVRQGIGKSFAGCVGFQIDGANFSEKIIAWAPPA
jgi:hypothetical protein